MPICGSFVRQFHGLRTPNEGINQRYLKNWADVADKICFGRTLNFGRFATTDYGLRTPNEGINQRYLEILANAADKICFAP